MKKFYSIFSLVLFGLSMNACSNNVYKTTGNSSATRNINTARSFMPSGPTIEDCLKLYDDRLYQAAYYTCSKVYKDQKSQTIKEIIDITSCYVSYTINDKVSALSSCEYAARKSDNPEFGKIYRSLIEEKENHATTCYELVVKEHNLSDENLKTCAKEASDGDPFAIHLTLTLMLGSEDTKAQEFAVRSYTRLAEEHNDCIAAGILGNYYTNGSANNHDFLEQARKWLLKAEEMGYQETDNNFEFWKNAECSIMKGIYPR